MRDGINTTCPGRDEFARLAADQLLPTVGRYGFTVVSEDSQHLRFENDKVWLALSYDERDCEVDLTFGRHDVGDKLSYGLFLRATDPVLAGQFGDGIATSPEHLRQLLQILATGLARTDRVLEGDDALFEEAGRLRWWHVQPSAVRPDFPEERDRPET